MRCTLLLVLLVCGIGPTALPGQEPTPSMPDTRGTGALLQRLQDTSEAVRAAAIAQIRQRGRALLPALDAALREPNLRTQHAAASARVYVGTPALAGIRGALGQTGADAEKVAVAMGVEWATVVAYAVDCAAGQELPWFGPPDQTFAGGAQALQARTAVRWHCWVPAC